jgi:ATP-binding protein involved in chromosome partitioning
VSSLPANVRPTGLSQDGPDTLVVAWSDGCSTRHAVRRLRLACKCAQCIDEWSGEALLDPDSVPVGVRPLRIDPIGHYGLQFSWSDGHSTGITTFETLWELADPDGTGAQSP